jgi:hypothetical protein
VMITTRSREEGTSDCNGEWLQNFHERPEKSDAKRYLFIIFQRASAPTNERRCQKRGFFEAGLLRWPVAPLKLLRAKLKKAPSYQSTFHRPLRFVVAWEAGPSRRWMVSATG